MYPKRISVALALSVTCVLLLSGDLLAVPTKVSHQDISPHCDPLFIPTQVDEIGDFAVFPPGEQLDAFLQSQTGPAVCFPFNDPSTLDPVVEIRNLTTKTFEQVWYVANRDTDISNYDGFANDASDPPIHEAFRIDNDISDPNGSHHPLISEIGGLPDGKWQPGEAWRFVLQDYFNALGLPPDKIDSIGVGDASPPPIAGIAPSTGSIIAIVPEPATCLLMILGLACTSARRFGGNG